MTNDPVRTDDDVELAFSPSSSTRREKFSSMSGPTRSISRKGLAREMSSSRSAGLIRSRAVPLHFWPPVARWHGDLGQRRLSRIYRAGAACVLVVVR